MDINKLTALVSSAKQLAGQNKSYILAFLLALLGFLFFPGCTRVTGVSGDIDWDRDGESFKFDVSKENLDLDYRDVELNLEFEKKH